VSAQAKGGQGNTDWDGEWSNAIKLMDEGATVTVKVEVRTHAPPRAQGGRRIVAQGEASGSSSDGLRCCKVSGRPPRTVFPAAPLCLEKNGGYRDGALRGSRELSRQAALMG